MRHLPVIAVLAATMRWRSATARRVAVPDLLVTLVTGSPTKLPMGSLRDPADGRRAAAVVSIVVGAFLGMLRFWPSPDCGARPNRATLR